MLFKLVVITVLVIAESADTCIKTVSYFLFVYMLYLMNVICFHLFANMEYFADPAELQSCKDSSSHSWHCKEWPECNPPCEVHVFDCFHIIQLQLSCKVFKFTYPYSRCCEYALLVLEYWADAPEIQRSADLYEDMIKCCVADAMSEVGSLFCTLFYHGMFLFAQK